MRVGGPGEVQEHILQVSLASGYVDDAESVALEGGEHLAGIHPVLPVGDGEGPIGDDLDLVEAGRLGDMVEIAVDRHFPRLLLRHPDQRASRLVGDDAAIIDDGDAIAKSLGDRKRVGWGKWGEESVNSGGD